MRKGADLQTRRSSRLSKGRFISLKQETEAGGHGGQHQGGSVVCGNNLWQNETYGRMKRTQNDCLTDSTGDFRGSKLPFSRHRRASQLFLPMVLSLRRKEILRFDCGKNIRPVLTSYNDSGGSQNIWKLLPLSS